MHYTFETTRPTNIPVTQVDDYRDLLNLINDGRTIDLYGVGFIDYSGNYGTFDGDLVTLSVEEGLVVTLRDGGPAVASLEGLRRYLERTGQPWPSGLS